MRPVRFEQVMDKTNSNIKIHVDSPKNGESIFVLKALDQMVWL